MCHFRTEVCTSSLGCCSGRDWSRLVKIRKLRNETENNLRLNACFSLADSCTAPHKRQQPAKLRHAPYGVRESGGCIRQQSQKARNKRRGDFVKSKLPASITKKLQSRRFGYLALCNTMVLWHGLGRPVITSK